ncbi:MerR family transcriptional regulator [Pseudonocardia abyssalis]|uniref:MerR family transcriptional regulator n=1 Tax=Pseudonocardia abyssalis TaxID=2792008 RepID=A0ABS6UNZ2_9PSEU|nr:MerR family transcriptional regulator [Pseudonocardia abyssalis]MBW0114784.1 MerR family transcriptional regulator [Pseudonocardia abyssalis]MBW0133972.1 MerR family transcriptional regulator [Pseudonocardia abyssalis]
MLTIGDFARLTHLSRKTLRNYHEAGLLEPDRVDPSTGYRYYSLAQVPTAQVIRRFRDLGMPVADVRSVLLADLDERAGIVAAHLARLEEQLAATQSAVTSLRRLLAPAPLRVELRSVPAQVVAGIGDDVDLPGVLAWYAGAMAELRSAGLVETGPPGARFDRALFSDDRGHVLAHVAVDDPPSAGRVRPVELPAVELAVAVHLGPHDDIDVTYGELGVWVEEQAVGLAGPVQETYLVGPSDTPDPTRWRTEIGLPVFGTAG